MKIFNLENPPKGVQAAKCECIVIGTFEEWRIILDAVGAQAKLNPRKKKLQKVSADLEVLSVW